MSGRWHYIVDALRWLHNGRYSVSNHQPRHCLLSLLFRRRPKKTSKLRVTSLGAGKSPGTGEFPAQVASNAENASIWWRHHEYMHCISDNFIICDTNITEMIQSWLSHVRYIIWYNVLTVIGPSVVLRLYIDYWQYRCGTLFCLATRNNKNYVFHEKENISEVKTTRDSSFEWWYYWVSLAVSVL